MRLRLQRAVCAALAAPLLLLTVPSRAALEAGVEFDEVVVVEPGGTELRLCSTGLMRYRRVLKGYAAALYLADCGADPLGDAPRRLELAYFWSVDGRRFGEAAEELLRRSLDPGTFAALEPRMRALHATYLAVSPGDRYALTYLPGSGTELSLNGRALARIDGADFARAYFGIWLGETPLDTRLRDALLAPLGPD